MLGAALAGVLVLGWLAGHRNSVNMPATLEPAVAEVESPMMPAGNDPVSTNQPIAVQSAVVPLYQPEPSSEIDVPRNNPPEGKTSNSCENKSRHADCLLDSAKNGLVGWCVPAAGRQYVCVPKPAPGIHPPFPPGVPHPPPIGFRH